MCFIPGISYVYSAREEGREVIEYTSSIISKRLKIKRQDRISYVPGNQQ
jgi:hypothetical protein